MNILIIDDEGETRARIARLLSRTDTVFQAGNGAEALALLEKEKVDLILTDICMPKMDGLEMIRILRSQGSSAEIIVMSGYSDFDYAHKAIKYNVRDYLLKPISPTELMSLVEEARKAAERRSYQERYGSQPFLNALFNGSYDHQGALARMEMLSLPVDFDYCLTGYVRLSTSSDAASIRSISEALSASGGKGIEAHAFLRGRSIAVLIFVKGITETYIWEKLSAFRSEAAASLGTMLWIGCSSPFRSMEMIAERDKEADALRRTTLFSSLLEFGGMSGTIPQERLEKDAGILSERVTTLVLSESSPDSAIDEFFRTLSLIARGSSYAEAEDRIARLLNALKAIAASHLESGKQKEITLEIDEARRIDNLFDSRRMIKRIANRIQKEYMEENIPAGEAIAEMIKRRIKENIANEAFSVADAIDGLNYSESYIRHLFTNREGMSIKEYITAERMEKAFTLLRNGTSVKETAEATGFANQRYFAKCFKDYTGMTPTEWKADEPQP